MNPQNSPFLIVTKLLNSVLDEMARHQALGRVQRRFLLVLLPTFLRMSGRANFVNLSRHCALSERTVRRCYQRVFDWIAFNSLVVARAVPAGHRQVVALDASFVPKRAL